MSVAVGLAKEQMHMLDYENWLGLLCGIGLEKF